MPQNLPDLAEVQAAVEVLDEVENIALRLTKRVPPAVPVMGDDQELALATTIFQGAASALADIQPPAAGHALQNGGAVPELVDADQIEPFPSAERASRRPEQTREHRAMADDAELQLFYVPLAETACELMFQVIADRAEKAAVIVTTNLPFSEWSQVIPNPRLCKALIDRLTDQAHIIITGANSYRFRRTTAQRKASKTKHEVSDGDATLTCHDRPGRSWQVNPGGWADIRQHKWAKIHGHSQKAGFARIVAAQPVERGLAELRILQESDHLREQRG